MVVSAISGPVYALTVFKVNGNLFPDGYKGIHFNHLKYTYYAGSSLFAIAFTIFLFGCLSTDSVFQEVSRRAVFGVYGMLIFFWGFLALVNSRIIDSLLKKSSDNNNKESIQNIIKSLYFATGGCFLAGAVGMIGVFIPHYNFHLFLVIQSISSINMMNWVQNTTPPQQNRVHQSPVMMETSTTLPNMNTSDVDTQIHDISKR